MIYIYIYIYIYDIYILYIYIYSIYIYDSQIEHHNPCFSLLILHNSSDNSFYNQRSEINKNNNIFLRYIRSKNRENF